MHIRKVGQGWQVQVRTKDGRDLPLTKVVPLEEAGRLYQQIHEAGMRAVEQRRQRELGIPKPPSAPLEPLT